jgi:hypothetical protein
MTGNKTITSQLKEDPRAILCLATGRLVRVLALSQPWEVRSSLCDTTSVMYRVANKTGMYKLVYVLARAVYSGGGGKRTRVDNIPTHVLLP